MPRAGIARREEDEEEGPHLRLVRGDEPKRSKKGYEGKPHLRLVKGDEQEDDGTRKDYQTFTNKIVSQVVPNERGTAKHILKSEKAKELYNVLKKEGIPERQMERFYVHGMNDLAQGKSISPRAYTMAVAEEIANYGSYTEALVEMQKEGLLTKDQYREVLHKMSKNVRDRTGRLSSALEELAEKEAAVWLFMAIGAILVLISGFSMTGAVVGSMFEVTSLFVIGIVLFLIGLVLRVKK
jgi:hypothetical protein